MDELFPSPAADFDHPIEILEACHQRIRRNCSLIERIARHLGTRGADEEARHAARGALRYFDDAGRNHHHDEEDDLFPAMALRARGEDRALVAAVVERLRMEHTQLEAAWGAMRTRLEDVAGGARSAVSPVEAQAFSRAYDRHMEIEEVTLFPLARRLLDAATVAQVGAAMAARRRVTTR
jgi:hemerythrin-like domain-containing protein